MLEAYCQELNEGIFAFEAKRKYEDKIRQFTWFCCPERHSQVYYVKGHERKVSDGVCWVIDHFRLQAEDFCPVGESGEHIHDKLLIASIYGNPDAEIQDIFGLRVNLNKIPFINEPKLEPRWNPHKFRADVGFAFQSFHPWLGQGICFEIQLSSISEELKQEKTKLFLTSGYSVSWLTRENFTEEQDAVKFPLPLQHPYCENYKYLSDLYQRQLSRMKEFEAQVAKLEEAMKRAIPLMMRSLLPFRHGRWCFICQYASIPQGDYYQDGVINCWFQQKKGKARRPDEKQYLDTCESFELRNWSIIQRAIGKDSE